MNAEAVRAALAAARDAGTALRARPPEVVHADLARVFDLWSDPESGFAERLADATFQRRHSKPVGLRPALSAWTGQAFLELTRQELAGTSCLGFPVTAVLLAGEIPMPSLLSMLMPLAVRSPVIAKMGRRDRATAPLVKESLEAAAPELAAAFHVVPPLDEDTGAAVLDAECILATGSDATIETLQSRLRPEQRLVAAGHRFSVAAIGDDALQPDAISAWAERAAQDIALWDQQGCLSPIAHFVVSRDSDAIVRWCDGLAEGLRTAQARAARGALSTEEAAALQHERAEAEMRAASDPQVRLLGAPEDGWTVVQEADDRMRAAPLNRFVRVHPVESTQALLEILRPSAHHLAGVTPAGFGDRQRALEAALAELGATRVCEPGTLQFPPLAWRREGRDILTPLLAPSA